MFGKKMRPKASALVECDSSDVSDLRKEGIDPQYIKPTQYRTGDPMIIPKWMSKV